MLGPLLIFLSSYGCVQGWWVTPSGDFRFPNQPFLTLVKVKAFHKEVHELPEFF